MPGPIRFGIIGCGHIAKRHAQYASSFGELIAVCDIVKDKADQLALTHKAKAYYSIEALLRAEKDLDAIAICTPNGLHASHSIQCLEAGIHVLCEKPMALSTAACKKMMDAAAIANKQLVIVKQNRFNPPVLALKKLLDEGKLGRLYTVQANCFWNRGEDYYRQDAWRGTKELDGGTLFTQFSHFIDILYWMVGEVKDVQAVLANYAHEGMIKFEDTGAVLFQFASGVTGSMLYTVNSFKKNMEGSFTIFAEKGTVKIGGQYLNEIAYQSVDGYFIDDLPSAAANNYGNYSGSMSNHDKVYKNLVDVIANNALATANALEGFKTVEIIEKIYKTARYA